MLIIKETKNLKLLWSDFTPEIRRLSDEVRGIITADLAGGLLLPCKGMILAGLKAPYEKSANRIGFQTYR